MVALGASLSQFLLSLRKFFEYVFCCLTLASALEVVFTAKVDRNSPNNVHSLQHNKGSGYTKCLQKLHEYRSFMHLCHQNATNLTKY